jgi:outer membrane lipoprotein-sorting protein
MSGPALADVLDDALAHFAAIRTYQVTLRSSGTPGGPFREVIRYTYRKPGWVRMEFVRPHQGLILLYDPEKRIVRLWPFGAKGPDFTLSPRNWLLTSAGGYSVDRSDIGVLLAKAVALRNKGALESLGEEVLADRRTLHVRVSGASGEVVEEVHRFELWLDADSLMPLKAEAYGLRDVPIDLVLMDDLALDTDFPERMFVAP